MGQNRWTLAVLPSRPASVPRSLCANGASLLIRGGWHRCAPALPNGCAGAVKVRRQKIRWFWSASPNANNSNNAWNVNFNNGNDNNNNKSNNNAVRLVREGE